LRRILLSIAVTSVVLGILYTFAAFKLKVGILSQPGPGMYPLFVGVLMFLAGLVGALEVRSEKAQAQVNWPQGAALWRIATVMGGCIIYAIIMPQLGHLIAAGLVSLVVLRAMREFRWPTSIAIAAGIALGSYLLFSIVLKVPFPAEIWSR
jgi:putative tricarboxylic transport membrane protein